MMESTVLLRNLTRSDREYMRQLDRYILRLLCLSRTLSNMIKRYAASIVFNIAYGNRIPSLTDPRLIQTVGVAGSE